MLTLSDVPVPVPNAGEALVKIAASGINYTDIMHRSGKRPGATVPFVPGSEASGTVEAIGADVTDVQPGDRVMYAMVPGSYANTRPPCRPIDSCTCQPISISLLPQQCRCRASPRTICYTNSVRWGRGRPYSCTPLPVAMGLLLTQYATHLGARVIGTTSTAEKAAKAKAAGASDVILYTETDFADAVRALTDAWAWI